MAYIPITYAPIEADTRRLYRYPLPTSGIKLSDTEISVPKGNAADLFNMDVTETGIETRCLAMNKTPYLDFDGSFHSMTKNAFCERIIIHAGDSIFSYADSMESLTVMAENIPDKPSIMCEFMSKLYIYCDGRIFSIDNTFNIVEELPYAPLIFDGVNASFGMSETTYDVFNLCAPIVKARYLRENNTGMLGYTLPAHADLTRPVIVYVNGEPLEKIDYTYNVSTVTLKTDIDINKDLVEIVFYLKTPSQKGYEYLLENCTLAESYGGNINSGTRIFFTGNADKKGYYFKSELQNPLYVPSDEYEIIGNGSEDVTAMKKMYGDLIIFTKSCVYRMSYQFSSDKPYFTVREIGNGVGCDCPESVCLIDNRVVFLNSEKGVFIVDSTEQTGEQNIKPISGNILSGKGKGLLDNDADALRSSYAVDFGRKYILSAGKRLYIWDYDKSAYRDLSNYSASQSRLIWYIYNNINAHALFGLKGKLYTLSTAGYVVSVFDRDAQNGITSGFSSGELDISDMADRKHVTEMSMILYCFGSGKINFTFYADGKEYCKKQMIVSRDKKMHLKLRLPAKALYSFGFDVLANSNVRIDDITFKYRTI